MRKTYYDIIDITYHLLRHIYIYLNIHTFNIYYTEHILYIYLDKLICVKLFVDAFRFSFIVSSSLVTN